MTGVVILAGILALAALGAAGIVLIVRSQRPPAVARTLGVEPVPTFRVVALGPRGSGKTLLLASMYHQMQTPSGGSYFLTAPYEQVALLNKWFTEVADPALDWPTGTALSDTREFTFAVRTRTPSGALHTVLNLGYLEYAGGLLTEPQAPGSTLQADLLHRVGTADALIGLIDGHRIRQWLDGRSEGQMRLQHTLTAMISLMMLVSCPITFVITKWDLLADIDADENGRLQIVRKLLMSNQGFRDLVNVHSAHRVVRLIPVSAVGPSFAALDTAGAVAKLPDGYMRPTNVDVPLAAVVPDVFEQVERSLNRAHLHALFADLRRRSGMGPTAALAELGAFVARTAGRALGSIAPVNASFVGDAVAALFRSPGGAAATERQMATERRLTEAERTVEEFHLARRKVIREFQSRVDVLEGRLPSSRLSGER
jgi:hypothetical protein